MIPILILLLLRFGEERVNSCSIIIFHRFNKLLFPVYEPGVTSFCPLTKLWLLTHVVYGIIKEQKLGELKTYDNCVLS